MDKDRARKKQEEAIRQQEERLAQAVRPVKLSGTGSPAGSVAAAAGRTVSPAAAAAKMAAAVGEQEQRVREAAPAVRNRTQYTGYQPGAPYLPGNFEQFSTPAQQNYLRSHAYTPAFDGELYRGQMRFAADSFREGGERIDRKLQEELDRLKWAQAGMEIAGKGSLKDRLFSKKSAQLPPPEGLDPTEGFEERVGKLLEQRDGMRQRQRKAEEEILRSYLLEMGGEQISPYQQKRDWSKAEWNPVKTIVNPNLIYSPDYMPSFAADGGLYRLPEGATEDELLYDYVNGDPWAREVRDFNQSEGSVHTDDNTRYKGLPQSVVDVYNTLWEKKGPETARQFLDDVTTEGATGWGAFFQGQKDLINSLVTAATGALADVTGNEDLKREAERLHEKDLESSAKVREEHPYASLAGDIASNLLMAYITHGVAQGLLEEYPLPEQIKAILENVMSRKWTTASKLAGDLSTGKISREEYENALKAVEWEAIKAGVTGLAAEQVLGRLSPGGQSVTELPRPELPSLTAGESEGQTLLEDGSELLQSAGFGNAPVVMDGEDLSGLLRGMGWNRTDALPELISQREEYVIAPKEGEGVLLYLNAGKKGNLVLRLTEEQNGSLRAKVETGLSLCGPGENEILDAANEGRILSARGTKSEGRKIIPYRKRPLAEEPETAWEPGSRPEIAEKTGREGVDREGKDQYNDTDTPEVRSFRERIRSGEQPLIIEMGKQGKHVQEHSNYIPGKSLLTVSEKEAQELVERYAGTGEIDFRGNGAREVIYSDRRVGFVVNPETGEKIPTNAFKIHYSKNGTHIVPYLKGE